MLTHSFSTLDSIKAQLRKTALVKAFQFQAEQPQPIHLFVSSLIDVTHNQKDIKVAKFMKFLVLSQLLIRRPGTGTWIYTRKLNLLADLESKVKELKAIKISQLKCFADQ